jgi:hypothetical protein
VSHRVALAVATVLLASVLTGCGALLDSPPTAAPEPFPGIAGQLGRFGIDVTSWTSGDPGCSSSTLSPTAVKFEAHGLDQATPVTLRIYIFKDHDAWDRRLSDVDGCAAEWATDPATFKQLQISPYVLAGQGPWPPGFADALTKGITASAGSGG